MSGCFLIKRHLVVVEQRPAQFIHAIEHPGGRKNLGFHKVQPTSLDRNLGQLFLLNFVMN
ncbi:MAG: hypothetical protein KJN87_10135 [Desulfofustis sp.]|nr:hypothetical protein [Desulfofustis sp.]